MKKSILLIGLLIAVSLVISGCSSLDAATTTQQTSSITITSTIEEREFFIACGCGCCVFDKSLEAEATERCLYHSKGDDINDFIRADEKAKGSPDCSYAGCSFPIKYVYCD